MMRRSYHPKNHSSILVMLFFVSPILFAANPWHLQPQQSSLTFMGTQNNAPITGKFTAFEGAVVFDPQQLKDAKIDFAVDMNSVSTSYRVVADTLKTADWFNVSLFPKARFTSTEIEKVDDNHYRAKGKLTIRDKTVPLMVDFNLKKYSASNAQVTGNFNLQRTIFGIGQGEWSNTDEIKNDVKVSFDFSLTQE